MPLFINNEEVEQARALTEGLHISAMQRDEFDDRALMACNPLVLHTRATERLFRVGYESFHE